MRWSKSARLVHRVVKRVLVDERRRRVREKNRARIAELEEQRQTIEGALQKNHARIAEWNAWASDPLTKAWAHRAEEERLHGERKALLERRRHVGARVRRREKRGVQLDSQKKRWPVFGGRPLKKKGFLHKAVHWASAPVRRQWLEQKISDRMESNLRGATQLNEQVRRDVKELVQQRALQKVRSSEYGPLAPSADEMAIERRARAVAAARDRLEQKARRENARLHQVRSKNRLPRFKAKH